VRILLCATNLCALPAHAQVAGTPAPPANAFDTAVVAKPVGDTAEQTFALHAQATFVVQGDPAFHAAFAGDNSLRARGETRETFAETLRFLERAKPHEYVFSCLSI